MKPDLSKRLTVEQVADLLRDSGFEVIGDDAAWIAKNGVVLDSSDLHSYVADRNRRELGFAKAVRKAERDLLREQQRPVQRLKGALRRATRSARGMR